MPQSNPQKPMLAGTITDLNKLRFPVLASRKLDGIRATVQGGVLLSRSLKPLPNVHVQDRFRGLPEGLDGELIVGDPTARDEQGRSIAFRRTESLVMSDNKTDGLEELYLWVFDRLTGDMGIDYFHLTPFKKRLTNARTVTWGFSRVKQVEHVFVYDVPQLEALEEEWLEAGNEGVMVRDPEGPYKYGRSTEKQGWLLKLKRFEDSEGEVIGAVEQFHNNNVEFKNELGRTARSSAQAGLVPTGVLGALFVRDLKTGVEVKVGTGFNAEQRKDLWSKALLTPGAWYEDERKCMFALPSTWKFLKYKFFPSGSKDKPRHPVFIGFRDERDMS